MQRKVMLLAGLLAVSGLGIVAAANEPCDLGAVPEALPVLALAGGEQLSLVESLGAVAPLPLLEGGQDTHACSGKIAPGVRAVFNSGWVCTLNWVYQDSAGALYIGTAGHCINFSCSSTLPSRDIRVSGVPGDIGDPAFSTGSCGVGNDFALIRIDPALYSYVNPTMCHWGGPTGVASTAPTNKLLAHFGHGVFWGDSPETQGRLGVNPFWGSGAITFTGTVAPGDSGSPIRAIGADNGAAGVITHTSSYDFPNTGPQYANRVDSGLARANAAQPGKNYHVVDGEMVDAGVV